MSNTDVLYMDNLVAQMAQSRLSSTERHVIQKFLEAFMRQLNLSSISKNFFIGNLLKCMRANKMDIAKLFGEQFMSPYKSGSQSLAIKPLSFMKNLLSSMSGGKEEEADSDSFLTAKDKST